MPAETTPDGIGYPVIGDKMTPLAGWFAQQAADVQAALTAIRSEVDEPDLPLPKLVASNGTQAITSAAWGDHPGIPAITLDLPRPCIVSIVVQGWPHGVTNADSRLSAAVTGATVLGEAQAEVGGPSNAWGAIVIQPATWGLTQGSATRTVRLNAGVNTIKLRIAKQGTGAGEVRYAMLQVSPIRWA